jgi:hypothetical protein
MQNNEFAPDDTETLMGAFKASLNFKRKLYEF